MADEFSYQGITVRHITQHVSPPIGRAIENLLKASRCTRSLMAHSYLQDALDSVERPPVTHASSYMAYAAVKNIGDLLSLGYKRALWALFEADNLQSESSVEHAKTQITNIINMNKRGFVCHT